MALGDIIAGRRSRYRLGREIGVTDGEIIEAVENAVRNVPSAYNSQSQRAALLLGHDHTDLWNITENALRKKIGDQRYRGATEEKINGFREAYGTVLFFDDMAKTCEFGNRYPSNVANFPIWAYQASGMLQYAVWLSFEEMGLGASLQHYNPLIDMDVKERWSLSEDWKLFAQMPFGSIESEDPEKEFDPIDVRMKVFDGKE